MKSSFYKHIIFLSLVFVWNNSIQGQNFVDSETEVGGILEGDQVWDTMSSPIFIYEDVIIPSGSKLTIDAGVIAGVKYGKRIIIEGTLIINGTFERPVIISTGQSKMLPTEKVWEGIEVNGPFAEVKIKGLIGGYANEFIHLNTNSSKKIEISHSYFKLNQTAFEFSQVGSNLYIHDNYISENEYGMVFNKPVPEKRIINNQVKKNFLFDLMNLSGKYLNLSHNCFPKAYYDSVDGRGGRLEIPGGNIALKPASNYCQPIPDLMNISGGDITVVLDDDVIGSSVDARKALDYSIYPNPSVESFKLEYYNFKPNNLLIINSLGQVVEEINQLPLREITIPVSHLPAGIYFIHLNTKQGIIRSRVVVMENW